jgi:hypothetical protein
VAEVEGLGMWSWMIGFAQEFNMAFPNIPWIWLYVNPNLNTLAQSRTKQWTLIGSHMTDGKNIMPCLHRCISWDY